MQKKLAFVACIVLMGIFCHQSLAQINTQRLTIYCDSLMNYGAGYPMIPGGVLSIATSDSIYLLKGYGYSNVELKVPVHPETTLFQLGSVGKVFTAISALQQVEQGKLDLTSDINSYLDSWKVDNPYDKQITLWNLLTHTAGFDDRVIGYLARNNEEIVSLAEHLASNMPSLFQPAGKNINYSNYSYALAGYLVEITSGSEFKNYVEEEIFDPLGMNLSTYHLPDDYESNNEFARGYQWREDFEEVKSFPRYATPAGSLISTGSDMTRFMQTLLNLDSALLNENSYHYLLNQQFSNHELLTGYTLGMEVQNFNGTPAVAKGGNIPGFLSVLFLFPEEDLGLFLAINTETDNFLELFFDNVLEEFFPAADKTEVKRVEVNLDEYTGVFINERANHHTIEEMFALFEGQFTAWESTSGNLACFHNGKTQEYIPIEDDIFQNADNPGQHIIFERNPEGKISNMYRNFVLGGIQIPASYRKAGWFERPRFINDEYPFALLIAFSYFFLPLGWIFLYFIRKRNKNFLRNTKIPKYYHAAAFIFLSLVVWNILGFWVPLLQDRQLLFFGLENDLYATRYFNYAMAAMSVVLLVLSFKQWISKHGNVWIRLYYLLFSLIAISHVLILHRWHFLSLVYK